MDYSSEYCQMNTALSFPTACTLANVSSLLDLPVHRLPWIYIQNTLVPLLLIDTKLLASGILQSGHIIA